jgi:signal transduction histidine kinase
LEHPPPAANGRASELSHARDAGSAERGAGDRAVTGVPLAQLISDVVEQLRPESEGERVDIHVEPPVAGAPAVPAALGDVLFNLVDNGIDAAASAVWVRVRRDGHGGFVVEVADDGPGLADAERSFEPFFTTKPDGTGMGLAIADAVLADLGGDLRWERTDGVTVFRARVPWPGAGAAEPMVDRLGQRGRP